MQTDSLKNVGIAFSAGATDKLPGWEKPHALTVAWSHDMDGHAQKIVERCCELATNKSGAVVQSFKSLFGCSSIQAGRIRISWRVARSFLANCLEMLVFGTHWTI